MAYAILREKFLEFSTGKTGGIQTVLSGSPWVANMILSLCIVMCMDIDGTITASSHLEWASTTSKNGFSMNCPAWSMFRRDHGWSGQFHGCSGDLGSAFWFSWHSWQFCTMASMPASILGHNTMLRARS